MPHELGQSQVFLNGNHMSAQNYVIIMLGFLALPGKRALSNQLKFIYLHTISGSEHSCFFMLMLRKYIYISPNCCNCFWCVCVYKFMFIANYFPGFQFFACSSKFLFRDIWGEHQEMLCKYSFAWFTLKLVCLSILWLKCNFIRFTFTRGYIKSSAVSLDLLGVECDL